MLSIGMAIVYNLGSNYFFGEISYITKALAAVLQLGVTLDYSIFLMHSYEEQQVRYNGDKRTGNGTCDIADILICNRELGYDSGRIYCPVFYDILHWVWISV